jgi:hypothetical protein
MCGAVLGESFDRTKERLGEPARKQSEGDQVLWIYSVDGGLADCIFTVADTRVIQIYASSVNSQPDPRLTDPYGVSLGSSTSDLVAKRGDNHFSLQGRSEAEEEEAEWVYPSRSGACWLYTFSAGEHHKDVIVTGIGVFLNMRSPGLDCLTR